MIKSSLRGALLESTCTHDFEPNVPSEDDNNFEKSMKLSKYEMVTTANGKINKTELLSLASPLRTEIESPLPFLKKTITVDLGIHMNEQEFKTEINQET